MVQKSKVKLMQYGISQEHAEEILNRDYNLTKIRNISIKELTKIFSEDKVKEWKEKIKRKRIPNKDFYKLLNKSDFECVICKFGNKLPIIIHHIDPYELSQNNEFDNLILLCLNHHDQVHTHSDLTRDKYDPAILKKLRDKRYKVVDKNRFELELYRIEEIETEPIKQLGYLFSNLIPIQIPQELFCIAETEFKTYNRIYEEAKRKRVILPTFILKEEKFIAISKVEKLEQLGDIININTLKLVDLHNWLSKESSRRYIFELINKWIKELCFLRKKYLTYIYNPKIVYYKFKPRIFPKNDTSKRGWDRIREKWLPGSKGLTCLKAYTSKTTGVVLNFQHLALKIKPIYLENRLFLSLIPTWIFTTDGYNFCSSDEIKKHHEELRGSKSNFNRGQLRFFTFWYWYLFKKPLTEYFRSRHYNPQRVQEHLKLIRIGKPLLFELNYRPTIKKKGEKYELHENYLLKMHEKVSG